MDLGRKWLVDFTAEKTQLVLFDQSNNTGAIDVKSYVSALEENSSFKMLGLTFPFKLDCGSNIISIAKTARAFSSSLLNAIIQSIFKFFTLLPKFSNVLPLLLSFNIPPPFFFDLFLKNCMHALTSWKRP